MSNELEGSGQLEVTSDEMFVCSEPGCGKVCKNALGKLAHERSHVAKEDDAPPVAEEPIAEAPIAPAPVPPVTVIDGPPPVKKATRAEPRNLNIPPMHKAHSNIRSVKMMDPRCRTNPETGIEGCEDKPGAYGSLWWKTCPHDPYHRLERHEENRPTLVEICASCEKAEADHDGSHTFERSGRLLQSGLTTYVWFSEEPNLRQVQLTPRVGGTLYGLDPVIWRRGNGWIMPNEHTTKPLVEFCEYHNCWCQNIVVRDPEYGNYCKESAAKRVKLDMKGKSIEAYNQEKLDEQMDATRVGGSRA